ncbi:MAG: hypothetical protein ACE5GY_02395 [Thermodesulfobacteriota bacterium]
MGFRSAGRSIPSEIALGLISEGEDFRFKHLTISGVDNEPVLARNAPGQREEEVCLFHKDVPSGDAYVALLADRIEAGMENRTPLPVVRFADGEYEFYNGSLKCNGLYRQAESVEAIRAALPAHADALRYLAAHGAMAPLLFPGNMRRRSGIGAFFRKKGGNDLALRFLEFLAKNGIRVTGSNYIPFYAVYAYLSGARFAAAVDGKTVCLVNSDFNATACSDWFERAGSRPRLVHVPVPDSYVATQWASMREDVFRAVPEDADCFLVGAGVGALQVCVDAARRFSVPAIDSGHILNMMNGLERKSQGPRLFTLRR